MRYNKDYITGMKHLADAINPMRCPRSISEMRKWIDEQPTAYDVDKVISYIDRLANNGTGKAKSLAYLKKFIENGCNVVELEEALKAINTIKEFCRQTSLGDCGEKNVKFVHGAGNSATEFLKSGKKVNRNDRN